MSEPVEAGAGHRESWDLPAEELVERLGVQRLTGDVGEHRVGGADGVGRHVVRVRSRRAERLRCRGRGRCCGGWWGVLTATSTERPPTTWRLGAMESRRPFLVQVTVRPRVGGLLPVAPSESSEFAASHAGVGGEVQCGVEP